MFENLSNQLSNALRHISGNHRLTEDNIKNKLREVRIALLEADTSLPVVKQILTNIKERALGKKIEAHLTTGQEFIKLVHSQLVHIMGNANKSLNLVVQPPAAILIAGLPGAGKTTSVGKLANFLSEKQKKKVLVVSADIYRPAAILQLKTLAETIRVDFFTSNISQKPIDIVMKALNHAKCKFYDVLLVDTAGCLHTNKQMMVEMIKIQSTIKPVETLLIVDAMTGQDATNIAKSFNEALSLTGIILTKVDGDARGGAALSIRYITGQPIKFIGTGETADALEPFYPERLASSILGMGDILSLIEKIESKINIVQAKKLTGKQQKSNSFDLNDFLYQLKQINKMGGIANIISKLPHMNQISNNIKSNIDDQVLAHMEAIIYSMTIKERVNPNIIKGSRKRRIAAGSGMQVQDINRLLKQFDEMQCIMKKIKQNKHNISKIFNDIKGIIPSSIRGR